MTYHYDDEDDPPPRRRPPSPEKQRAVIERIRGMIAEGKARLTIHDGKPAVAFVKKRGEPK